MNRASVPVLIVVLIGASLGACGNGPRQIRRGTHSTPLTCFTPVRVEALKPDGTTQPAVNGDGLGRDYTFADGFHEVVPPANFDPASASDSELSVYGFPPRPTDPAALAKWNALARNWNPRLRDLNPHPCVPPGING